MAQDTCLWLLPQLPPESQVAVIDSAVAAPAFQVDLVAARQRVERLESEGVGRPLVDSLLSAAELLKDAPQERKEIYVFTDLSQAAWKTQSAARLQERIRALGHVGVYLIDVGVKDPRNFTLGEIQLSGQVLARNSPLRVQSDLSVVGTGGERVVELYLLDPQGHPQSAARRRSRWKPAPRREWTSPWEVWTRGRTRATCGSWARTGWRSTMCATSRST